MTKPSNLRSVQCYHCRTQMEISLRAMTVSCPACHKKLLVEDVTINNAQSVTKLQTCGKVVVEKNGRIIAQLVEAAEGIEVHGILEAKEVVTFGKVFIGPKAQWKGDCRAPALQVELGARITRGFFEIQPEGTKAEPGASPMPASGA